MPDRSPDDEYDEYDSEEEEQSRREIEMEAIRIVENEPVQDSAVHRHGEASFTDNHYLAAMQSVGREAKDLVCFANMKGRCTEGSRCKYNHSKEKIKEYLADLTKSSGL